MIVGIEAHFDAAHYLPNYSGKCKNLHGHTWTVEVEVNGEVEESTGMVVDLSQLKKDVNILLEAFDHRFLNEHFHQPTCENIALWIHDKLIVKYSIQSVKVKEGIGGYAKI